MHRFIRHTALIGAALALTGCLFVATAAASAQESAASHVELPIAVAEIDGVFSRTRKVLHASMHGSLKENAARHLAEFGREMRATTQNAMRCKVESVGSGHGVHSLCADLLRRGSSSSPCVFYSYDISHDYSFDTMMADEWGCKGVALDPSVTYSSKLHPRVTFHNIAARTMDAEEDAQWDLVTTVPGLKKFLGHERVNVLKMDCEGCEYALAQDILREDPKFLHSVDQLAIEIHVSQKWLKSEVHAHHLGMLYALAEAGLRLVETVFGGCHPDDEAPGCHPVLQEAGFPCQKGMMCNNLLFARV